MKQLCYNTYSILSTSLSTIPTSLQLLTSQFWNCKYTELGFKCLCRNHNPIKAKKKDHPEFSRNKILWLEMSNEIAIFCRVSTAFSLQEVRLGGTNKTAVCLGEAWVICATEKYQTAYSDSFVHFLHLSKTVSARSKPSSF